MIEIKNLLEQKGELYEQLKQAASVSVDDYDDKKVDAINEDITALDKKIRSLESANRHLSELADEKDKIDNFEEKKETLEFKLRDYIRNGKTGDKFTLASVKDAEERANQFYKGTTTAGGYLVPDLVGMKLAGAQAYIGGMVTPGLCDRRTVATGQKLTFPTYDDTGRRSTIIAEKTDTAAASTDVTYGTAVMEFFKLTTSFVKVSKELIQDSVFPMVEHLLDLLAKRQARGENYYFTIAGDGTGDPFSIQSVAPKGVDAAKRGITRANLVDLIYSVNRAYRQGAAFQMNDSTIAYIRKLAQSSGSTGQDQLPAWQESMRAGEPALLEGYPVISNPDMDDINQYDKPIYFGGWKAYMILDALPWEITRVDELYAATDEIGFKLTGRIAGNIVDGGDPIKHIRNAST